MRKVVLIPIIVLSALVALSSCKSKEQKADALIKDYMFKHLHDYDSYEAVETKVDSAYNTPFFHPDILSFAADAIDADEEKEELKDEVESASRIMDIWEDSWSASGRERYYEAREDFVTKYRDLCEATLNYTQSLQGIRHLLDSLDREFIGWSVSHSYRCKTKGGNSVLSNDVFVMDKKFKSILYHFEEEEIADLMTKIKVAQLCRADELDSLAVKANNYYNQAEKTYQSLQ